MNIKRLLLAMFAGFVLIFLTDFLIHGLWLAADYEASKSLWRPETEMHAHFSLMIFAQVLCAATFVLIWARGFAGQGIGTGIGFGLLMGLFQQIWAIINYVVLPMPGSLAAKWFFSGLVQAILLGILTALIYKPEQRSGSYR
jgi:hypothetical protein